MSIKALDYGVMFSLKFSSKLTLISVIEEFKLPFAAEYSLWSAESRNRLEKEIYESLNNAVNTIREKYGDLNIQVRVEEGRPAQVIAEMAKKENYDLIIMGNRGYSKLEQWMLGSVSKEIVNISQKPVLVIK